MTEITMLKVTEVIPGNNDRTIFDQGAITELAENIKTNGLVQPITVRYMPELDLYQIVAGERRFRACCELGMEEIQAIVKDMDDEQASAVMLAENTSRENLDPIDEADAYQSRIDSFGWSIARISESSGKSTIHIRFRIKLLSLRAEIQNLIRTGNLSVGYAQIIADAGLDTNRQMMAVSKLRDNRHPTTGWFRGIVNELVAQQSQSEMFGSPLMGGQYVATSQQSATEPPHPSTTKAPAGKTLHETVAMQADFWKTAADEWAKIGKPFKRQECLAAATALQALLV